mmetsp:Transcript_76599/g.221411  ORF Transcript_76599/g.221411 Transcript_76599/m.221411 type:complete len:251 (-) Transcript_76599:409-1161(-)
MPFEQRRVHMMCQLILQRLRQRAHHRNLLLLHQFGYVVDMVLQKFDDASRKPLVDMSLSQIPAQKPKLSQLVAPQVPQSRHGGCDRSNDRGEDEHGEQQHNDGHDTLRLVPGADVHGCRGELRQTPMQCRGIQVADALVLHAGDIYPSEAVGVVLCDQPCAQVPTARDDMVHHDDECKQLREIEKDEGVLAFDHVRDKVEQPFHFQQTEQTQNSSEAHHSGDLRYVAGARVVLPNADRGCEEHDPLREND